MTWAQDVVDAAASLDVGVRALRSEHGRQLRVIASMTIAEYLAPNWLATIRRESPAVAVSLALANSAAVAEAVLDGDADLGFVEGPLVPPGLKTRVVGQDRLEVVVAPTHPWARRRRPLSAHELAATPLIQREPGSGTRYTLDRVLENMPALADPMMELSSISALKARVATGMAPAVISSLAVSVELSDRRLVAVPVDGVDLRRRLRAVWVAGRPLLGPGRDFVAIAARRG